LCVETWVENVLCKNLKRPALDANDWRMRVVITWRTGTQSQINTPTALEK